MPREIYLDIPGCAQGYEAIKTNMNFFGNTEIWYKNYGEMLNDTTLSGWFRRTFELPAWRHLAAGGPHELGRQLQHKRPCGVHQGGILSSMDTRSVRIVSVLMNDNFSFSGLLINVKYITTWLMFVLTKFGISTQKQRTDRQTDRRNSGVLVYELQCLSWYIAVRHIHNCYV